MQYLIDTISNLKNKSSRKEKELILKHAINSYPPFYEILLLTYDPSLIFGVNKTTLDKIKPSNESPLYSEEDVFDYFRQLTTDITSNSLKGNTLLYRLQEFAKTSGQYFWEHLYKKVLLKNLDCGVGLSTIKKFLEIKTFDVALADSYSPSKMDFNKRWCIEPKLDGVRCISVIKDGVCSLFTRNGKQLFNFPHIEQHLLMLFSSTPQVVLDGELISNDFQTLMTTLYAKNNPNTSNVSLHLFDAIPYPDFFSGVSNIPYFSRRRILDPLISSHPVYITNYFSIYTPNDVDSYYERFVNDGYEGAIVKNLDSPYRCKRTNDWLKIKPVKDFTLKLIDIVEGTGKYQFSLGALVGQSIDYPNIIVHVGTGFSDSLREQIWANKSKLLGSNTLFDISSDGLTNDNSSFRFPRFLKFRGDL